jgi:hypothetical protein
MTSRYIFPIMICIVIDKYPCGSSHTTTRQSILDCPRCAILVSSDSARKVNITKRRTKRGRINDFIVYIVHVQCLSNINETYSLLIATKRHTLGTHTNDIISFFPPFSFSLLLTTHGICRAK